MPKPRYTEEIKFKNYYGDCSIMIDGAEGGNFWIMEEFGEEKWIPIPFKEMKKVLNFLNKWMERIDKCKK